jgi:hypothetical protein
MHVLEVSATALMPELIAFSAVLPFPAGSQSPSSPGIPATVQLCAALEPPWQSSHVSVASPFPIVLEP